MRSVRSAIRYAQALLGLAKEESSLDAVKADMELILRTLSQNSELRVLMQSPVIRAEKKHAILTEIFENRVEKMTMAFLQLLAKKHREMFVVEIAQSFIHLWRVEMGIVKVHISSAQALSAAQRESMIKWTMKWTGSKVELDEIVNPDLIGGFVLRADDKQLDATISSRLNELKRSFDDNLYIAEF
jgi:F-type H+-transporting ATPase subunit delta